MYALGFSLRIQIRISFQSFSSRICFSHIHFTLCSLLGFSKWKYIDTEHFIQKCSNDTLAVVELKLRRLMVFVGHNTSVHVSALPTLFHIKNNNTFLHPTILLIKRGLAYMNFVAVF